MTKISIIQGDITTVAVDAIVNAANERLLGGGGVDGAIHRAAGVELYGECKTLGGCFVGEAKITQGYNLPAKHVIHTVGPIYGETPGMDAVLLTNCYQNSLRLAKEYGLKSVAFPAISTGVFRYPKDEAAEIATQTVMAFIAEFPECFDEIVFVLFEEWDYSIYGDILKI